jgi:polyribonucleotide nucleotidyltransferase
MDDGSKVFDPTFEEIEKSKLNLTVAGTSDAITMVEADGKEASDEEMVEMLEYSHELIKKFCDAQIDYLEDYKKTYGHKEIV